MRDKLQKSWVHQLDTIWCRLYKLLDNHLILRERIDESLWYSWGNAHEEYGSELNLHLIHVRLDQNLTHKGLCISGLVDCGVRPQAVTHHVHIGCLEAFDEQTLQGLLQHGSDPCNTLRQDKKSFQSMVLFKKNKSKKNLIKLTSYKWRVLVVSPC